MHSIGIVQWNSTRRDHSGNPGGVSGSGPVILSLSSSMFFPIQNPQETDLILASYALINLLKWRHIEINWKQWYHKSYIL